MSKHIPHQQSNDSLDYSSVMAVAVHDMKNSLSLLLQSIEQLAKSLPKDDSNVMDNVNSVHYEANRMNTTLVQVLSLYRASIESLPINIDEVYIHDLFEEIVDSNQVYIQQQNIDVRYYCDPDLEWYFDKELIYLMIHDVLINAIRYGCTTLRLNADIHNDMLTITVEDNGPGYPKTMLEKSSCELSHYCISEGRTGLGLFFARLIANTHQNKDRHGFITLANRSCDGGSIFTLGLP